MNDQQVRKALEDCYRYINKLYPDQEARELSEGSKESSQLFIPQRVQHLLWMCVKAELLIDNSCPAYDADKAHRWLVFIQGCMWMMGCSINEMRTMNRPGSPEAKDDGT